MAVNERKQNIFGEMTVFLSLILVIMISLLFTVINAARANAMEFQTECVADMGLQSSLAEYSRPLLDQYDLFFVDIGYGTRESGYVLLENHIKEYMEENFHVSGMSLTGPVRDLLGMRADYAAVLGASGAADQNGSVMERSALDYMQDKFGMLDVSDLSSNAEIAQSNGYLEDDVEESFREVCEELEELEDNPILNVTRVRQSSSRVLRRVADGKEISGAAVNPSDYISHRGVREKNGFIMGEGGISRTEDLLFQKYLMEKCGYFTQVKEGSRLKYQMEYILEGEATDQENITKVVKKLVGMREVSNFAYIMTDSDKTTQAETLATAVTILIPELMQVVKLAILMAWSYSESLNDVRILLDGGKVPLVKSRSSWELSMIPALTVNLQGDGDGSGLTYSQYLHILLAVQNAGERNMRFMDIAEMDVRMVPGNEGFSMDNCINAYRVEAGTSSDTGNSYLITRTVGFKK